MIMLEKLLSHIFIYNRLLDRDQVGDKEATLDDEDESGFLKAFKVDSHMIYQIRSCASNLIYIYIEIYKCTHG